MKFSLYPPSGLDPAYASDVGRAAEDAGYDGLWVIDGPYEPFVPTGLAASTTCNLRLRTAVAVAFARNPMVTAQLSHSLARLSEGRFELGLGPQVRAHIERRFSEPWGSPARRMAEYVEALRAIWRTWNTGEPLRFEGAFWSFTLMTPLFDPGPSGYPPPAIHLAAVGPRMMEVAAEYADGVVLHPLTSPLIIDSHVAPRLDRRRKSDDFEVSLPVMVVTGSTDEEYDQMRAEVRSRIAFYAATPSYQWVLEEYGERDRALRLQQLSREGKWREMPKMVTEELLQEFSLEAPTGELRAALLARFGSRLDSIGIQAGGAVPNLGTSRT